MILTWIKDNFPYLIVILYVIITYCIVSYEDPEYRYSMIEIDGVEYIQDNYNRNVPLVRHIKD
jgi:hypothetical protein